MNDLKLLTICAALLFALGACSDDGDGGSDPGTEDTQGDTTADVGGNDTMDDTTGDDTTGDDTTGEAFPDTTFRLVGVNIISPAGVGPILGNLITSDINNGDLHVLIQLTNFDGPWPTTFDITGNAGQEVEGGYTWYEGVAIDEATGEIDADGFFASTSTLSIVFPALEPGATEPIQIPVDELNLEGELFEDGEFWVIQGTLSGAILADKIEGITVNLGEERALADLLGGEEAMDFPVDAAEGEYTGWRLEGDITAENVTFVDAM